MIIILRNYRAVIVFLVLFGFFAFLLVAPPHSEFFWRWFLRIGPVAGVAITVAALMYSFRK